MFFSSLLSSYFDFISNFYNFLLILIFIFLILKLFFMMFFFEIFKKDILSVNLEIFLTFFSFFIIFIMFLPTLSFIIWFDNNDKILLNEELIIINIFGYQWYWNYSIINFNFDSMMFELNSLNLNNFFNFFSRNFDNNFRLVLPFNYNLLFISLSDNVIHSWFIPELNLKLETNPGFMNYFLSKFNKFGLFFGNCAEICGQGHSNMPILIEVTNYKNFLNYYLL